MTRQYLVHSFLYYQLGETLIPDAEYDQICQELYPLLQREDLPEVPFLALVRQALGPEASGYTLRKYPPSIISTALHLLHQSQAPDQQFGSFCERLGYRLHTPA